MLSIGRGPIPRVLVGDFGEGHVEGSGKVGTGTIEVRRVFMLRLMVVYGSRTHHSLNCFGRRLMVGTRSSRVLSTKADMFSLGMVIHFMAFRGKLPYTATGETLESLDELRREVQAFPG